MQSVFWHIQSLTIPIQIEYNRLVCVCVCVCMHACSILSDSLRPHGLQPTRLLFLWDFSRQGYWSRLPFPTPGDFPDLGIELASLASPALAGRFFTWEALLVGLGLFKLHYLSLSLSFFFFECILYGKLFRDEMLSFRLCFRLFCLPFEQCTNS